jgi:hypothetical protein
VLPPPSYSSIKRRLVQGRLHRRTRPGHEQMNQKRAIHSLVLRALVLCVLIRIELASAMSSPAPPSSTTTVNRAAPSAERCSLDGSALRQVVTQAARLDQASSVDLTGLVWMEHVNLVFGNAALAEDIYIEVLGCTRDADKSFHVNLGNSFICPRLAMRRKSCRGVWAWRSPIWRPCAPASLRHFPKKCTQIVAWLSCRITTIA